MRLLVNFETGGDADEPIGDLGGDEYGLAQSFQLAQGETVGRVELFLKKVNSISAAITVRIETDAAGPKPSGNLVHASATTTITPSNTSYEWIPAVFPAEFALSGATKYWIVCTVPGGQTTNDHYDWQRDSGNGYADGGESLNLNAGGFGNESGSNDLYFRVYSGSVENASHAYFM